MKYLRSFLCLATLLWTGAGPHLWAISLDNWSLRSNPNGSAALLGAHYAQGLFVAVGEQGTILTSIDGSNWLARASGTTTRLRAVTYGKGMYVAVGGDPSPATTRIVVTSSNGIAWVAQPVTFSTSLGAVAFGNGT